MKSTLCTLKRYLKYGKKLKKLICKDFDFQLIQKDRYMKKNKMKQ